MEITCPPSNNFKSVLEFGTLLEGYDYCRLHGPNPFVVRNCCEFSTSTPVQIRNQINLEAVVHGYNDTGTHRVTGRVAYEQWLNNTLDFNIVDSSSSRGSNLLPSILRELNIANDVDTTLWFSYVLTSACVQSKCHIDPPFGSGWQYLSTGNKEWTIIDRTFFRDVDIPIVPVIPIVVENEVTLLLPAALYYITKTCKFSVIELSRSTPSLAMLPLSVLCSDPPGSELPPPVLVVPLTALLPLSPLSIPTPLSTPSFVGLEHSHVGTEDVLARQKYPFSFASTNHYDMEELSIAYPKELYRVVLNANDFISFPEDWPHAVYTSQKTCGLSGYMKYEKE